ncbi:hypothetical protein [Metaclostridioides mangenotii]|uniref:hypothetical protein n=1 Tax=Metaclostridioides mangenotii TaxID=1540 RepID=UPI0004631637|nr:hypothetical protein [Clostridioides mangenotii]
MARKCKCRICKASLTTDIAYKVVNNSNKNEYYCSQKEYEDFRSQIEYRNKFSLKLDDIFGGDPIINNYKWILYNQISGYSNEEIYNCLLVKEKDIEWALSTKLVGENETSQLRYIFGILKNSIRDTSKQLYMIRNNNKKIEQIENSYMEEDRDEEIIVNKVERKGLMSKLKGIL